MKRFFIYVKCPENKALTHTELALSVSENPEYCQRCGSQLEVARTKERNNRPGCGDQDFWLGGDSLAITHLVFTSVTPSEWTSLETAKSNFGRSLLKASYRASMWAVHAELGWSPLKSAVLRARLSLVGRIFRGEGGAVVKGLTALRLSQLQSGEPSGFLGRERKIFENLDLLHFWHLRPFPTKSNWSKIVRKAVDDADVQLWREWKGGGTVHESRHKALAKRSWGREVYVSTLQGKQLAIVAAMRLGATNAGAGKLSTSPIHCTLCNQAPRRLNTIWW